MRARLGRAESVGDARETPCRERNQKKVQEYRRYARAWPGERADTGQLWSTWRRQHQKPGHMPHVSHVVTCHNKPHIDARYKLDDKVERRERKRERARQRGTRRGPRRGAKERAVRRYSHTQTHARRYRVCIAIDHLHHDRISRL